MRRASLPEDMGASLNMMFGFAEDDATSDDEEEGRQESTEVVAEFLNDVEAVAQEVCSKVEETSEVVAEVDKSLALGLAVDALLSKNTETPEEGIGFYSSDPSRKIAKGDKVKVFYEGEGWSNGEVTKVGRGKNSKKVRKVPTALSSVVCRVKLRLLSKV